MQPHILKEIEDIWEPMLKAEPQHRPHLTVELTNGIRFREVCLSLVTWYVSEGVVLGACFSFASVYDPRTTIIQDVDFDDIYEIVRR